MEGENPEKDLNRIGKKLIKLGGEGYDQDGTV
jgi:hypothetical protein